MRTRWMVALFASTCLATGVVAGFGHAQELLNPVTGAKQAPKPSAIDPAPPTSAVKQTAAAAAAAGQTAPAGVQIVADDIGGVVKGAKGPEAGVWVIAETTDLPTKMAKMVVTDDQGRFVIPQLPKANYRIWSRGYGLVDSDPVTATPGMAVNLTAKVAPDAKIAAEYYPSNYWYALIQPPAASQFPGSGGDGNGINPEMKTQQSFLANMKENCMFCHQLGDKSTRELANNTQQGWRARLALNAGMNNNFGRFGQQAGLKMFTDWTNRIAEGEIPQAAPARPQGVERNMVITVYDWAAGHFVHDQISSDHRDPTVNAGGPVYGMGSGTGTIEVFDPKTLKTWTVDVPQRDTPTAHNEHAVEHTNSMDQKGRVWVAANYREGPNPAYCTDPGNKFAKFYPMKNDKARITNVYDPETKKVEVIPECAESDHLNFDVDKNNTVYFSGEFSAMGWIDTKVWDETHDISKAEGWCPLTLDTNGNGKIDPGPENWNYIEVKDKPNLTDGPVVVTDPKKDTLIRGFIYGVGVSPKDHSVWGADYIPYVPGALIRMERGANPPETCHIEYYEPPLVNGKYLAFNPRGVDVDSEGIAWVAFASGNIGRFDRSKCTVFKGPTAVGQQCAAGWKIYDLPGAKVSGTDVNSDHVYSAYIDRKNLFGLGKDVPFFPGTQSDSILAFLPKTEKWVVIRVPYPMGFYTRGVDLRVDDPKAGWREAGLWSSYSNSAMTHQETGTGSHIAHFQLRPDPLAH